jgi:hypothetical protein
MFKLFPELQKFALANVGSIDTREKLMKHFKPLRFVLTTASALFFSYNKSDELSIGT